ncbi:hypothetical protein BC833DRAFT_582692 [Globomyces pollinis-pini]|nr:hypothetical protein BC833DRAFT_582692 [Globomyces pollinis-pini]
MNEKLSSILDLSSISKNPTFLSPLLNSDSCATLFDSTVSAENTPSLQTLPIELFTMIAMSSGFMTCMKLRQTCRFFRNVLDSKSSWNHFHLLSPDIITTKAYLDTTLRQFDQIIFAEWFKNDQKSSCIIHRTFLEQYDYLGGVSLVVSNTGKVTCEFFEHRERLPCYIDDVRTRMANGTIPPTLGISSSPIGGIRVEHSCPECEHYDSQTVIRSEFVHGILADESKLEYTYKLHPKRHVSVTIRSIVGVTGYNTELPAVTTKLWKLNEHELSGGLLNAYMRYIGV